MFSNETTFTGGASNSTSNIVSANITQLKLDPNEFSESEKRIIDLNGLSQHILTITFSELTEEVYLFMRDVARLQNKLPMKHLKLVPGTFEYVSQKSQIFGKEQDIRCASVTIEPLNNDYANTITYTPINQSIPIDTVVTLNISTIYNDTDTDVASQKFFWSNNLKTVSNVRELIKKENPNSITLEPWMKCVHYGSIDIGSVINAKYTVDWVDTDMYSSYSLYNFRRDDVNKKFIIWIYDAWNINHKDLLELISAHDACIDSSKKICSEIISKLK